MDGPPEQAVHGHEPAYSPSDRIARLLGNQGVIVQEGHMGRVLQFRLAASQPDSAKRRAKRSLKSRQCNDTVRAPQDEWPISPPGGKAQRTIERNLERGRRDRCRSFDRRLHNVLPQACIVSEMMQRDVEASRLERFALQSMLGAQMLRKLRDARSRRRVGEDRKK